MNHIRLILTLSTCVVVAAIGGAIQGCGDVADSLFGNGQSPPAAIGDGGGVYGIFGSDGSNGSQGPCVGLCTQQVSCPNGGSTTLSGTVYAPTPVNPDPLYNAIVYVPNAPVMPFAPGVSCDQCGADVSGAPLVDTLTGPDGKFTLTNVPVGTNIPLVIQIGRWRRQITVPNVAKCADTPLTADQTRLPRNKSEGDIPLTAFSTGAADALECVLRKMGVDDAEFTLPSGDGRMRLYDQNGATMPGIPPASMLWSDPAELAKYDIVILDCEGHPYDKPPSAQQNLINYTNTGGRVFASHYSYVWLYNDAPFSGTANWNVDNMHPNDPLTGIIDTSFPKGQAFAQWLGIVQALSGPGTIAIHQPRYDVDSVIPPSTRWIYSQGPNTLQHYTFNTPVGATSDKQCGRVVFSDFHVTAQMGTNTAPFPGECDNGPLLPQEKVLEFMMFDLASCIQNDNNPPVPPQPTK